jgi:hypothetical protein
LPIRGRSPDEIAFRGHFELEIAGVADQISGASPKRPQHSSLTAGDRYLKLAFREEDHIEMLFVVDRNAVPSVGKKAVLKPDTRGPSFEFK